MYCYQCGSKLGSGKYCLRCGADVTVYKKIVRISNTYYNAGLEKARLRDLTGAVEALNISLQYDKKNIDARNLLGLIYYEMGEVVEAVIQWILSKNFKAADNLADEYLNSLQEDRNQLDSMNQAIKKYNQALVHAQNDGKDLAEVQLRRVIKQSPNFLKAYQLLALLYIEDEDYSRANRLLRKALKIDRGNTFCLKYSRMIRGKLSRNRPARGETRREPSGNERLTAGEEDEEEEKDVIVPASSFRDRAGGFRTVLWVLAGIVIAVVMYQFVIARTITRNSNIEDNQTASSYATKLTDKDLEIQTLTMQLEDLEAQQEEMSGALSAYTDSDEGILPQYDALLTLVNEYITNGTDHDALSEAMAKIDPDVVESDTFQAVYEEMEQYVTVDMVSEVFDEGLSKFNTYYYTDAIGYFEQCLDLNPDYDPAVYYLGLCYQKKKQPEEAEEYFQEIVDNYPDSEFYEDCESRLE